MQEKVTIRDVPVNAEVECVDGGVGRSTYIILNPTTDEVTHVVVKDHDFPAHERLVSVDQIVESTPRSIRLRCTRSELGQMELFKETEYLPVTPPQHEIRPYLRIHPYVLPEKSYMAVEHEHVPPGELAVRRGAKVEASDGQVGQVDEFLVDPANGQITHLVLREGHLWGQKDVTIPVSAINHIQEDTVYLTIDKQRVGELPAIPVHRLGW